MKYADNSFYTTEFGGSAIPAEQLDSFLTKASRNIDLLTRNKIVGSRLDTLTAFQQELVKVATCYQADHLYQYGEAIASNIQSYSNGDNSVSLGDNVDMRYSRQAVDTLLVTGLLYRGL